MCQVSVPYQALTTLYDDNNADANKMNSNIKDKISFPSGATIRETGLCITFTDMYAHIYHDCLHTDYSLILSHCNALHYLIHQYPAYKS